MRRSIGSRGVEAGRLRLPDASATRSIQAWSERAGERAGGGEEAEPLSPGRSGGTLRAQRRSARSPDRGRGDPARPANPCARADARAANPVKRNRPEPNFPSAASPPSPRAWLSSAAASGWGGRGRPGGRDGARGRWRGLRRGGGLFPRGADRGTPTPAHDGAFPAMLTKEQTCHLFPSAPDQPGWARAAVPPRLCWVCGAEPFEASGSAPAAPGPSGHPPLRRFPSCSRAWRARGPIVSRRRPGDPCRSRRAVAGAALLRSLACARGTPGALGPSGVRAGSCPHSASWGRGQAKVRTEIPSNLFKGLAAAACVNFFFLFRLPPPPAPSLRVSSHSLSFPGFDCSTACVCEFAVQQLFIYSALGLC